MWRLPVLLLSLTAGACASSGAIPRPFPGPAPVAEGERAAGVDPGADALATTALALRGRPYKNGGSDPSGFDCSGFVQYVYAQHGITLPRTVGQQFASAAPAPGAVTAGDLVFFSTIAPGASHVGIALGPDEFIHAPSSTGEVRVERVSSSYWSRRYLGARRVR